MGQLAAIIKNRLNASGTGPPNRALPRPDRLASNPQTTVDLSLSTSVTTHLSFPEIGAELSLARTAIKSQAISIYRKLGAQSRSGAVARARELGLLEG